ncbi:ABC transporter ATP-binding protein [Actinocrispum wychmicini]|uniref:ABC-2 type transport system ATP-binding protein n=1 Tax=Actinocrispum wychmicini TaxID=1213861 RepID=A0A4R2JPU7_9PSEU|nr:ABC-2 type transport system ATP-binding protein [Actinocrispum wychmicini]
MSAIAVTNISKSFGKVRAVSDLSFTVGSGTVTAFLGPNGAGKTTTLRMILGLVKPDRGTATIHGTPYLHLRRPNTTVGAVLEATSFHPGRTARAHLTALCVASGLSTDRVGQVLDQVGLAAGDRRVGGFSLGMRQRLALASALLGDPAVLILDEPANGLDPEGIHWLRGFLRALAAGGCTVLVSSHVLAEMSVVADRVIVVNKGRLVVEAPMADFGDLEEAYLELVKEW